MLDGGGPPSACFVSVANVHDVCQLLPMVVADSKGRHGTTDHLRCRLYADREYGSADHEALVRWMGIEPVFAHRNTEYISRLGPVRYVVERTIANIHEKRCLKIRYERLSDIHQVFLTLAASESFGNAYPRR